MLRCGEAGGGFVCVEIYWLGIFAPYVLYCILNHYKIEGESVDICLFVDIRANNTVKCNGRTVGCFITCTTYICNRPSFQGIIGLIFMTPHM